jgi:hypothetical protein
VFCAFLPGTDRYPQQQPHGSGAPAFHAAVRAIWYRVFWEGAGAGMPGG